MSGHGASGAIVLNVESTDWRQDFPPQNKKAMEKFPMAL
jgi:hypothetical protein